MKMMFTAVLTAALIVLCFYIETVTPFFVAGALWCAFVLGTFFGIEGYRAIEKVK